MYFVMYIMNNNSKMFVLINTKENVKKSVGGGRLTENESTIHLKINKTFNRE